MARVSRPWLRGGRRGQMFLFVLIMLIIAILLALLYWFSASSGYSQNARSAGRIKIDIVGRTGGEALGNGIGQQAAGPQVGPDGMGQRPPPPGAVPVPPAPPLGPRPAAPGPQPAAPGGAAAPRPIPPSSGQVGPAPDPGFIGSGTWVNQLEGILRDHLQDPTTRLIPLDGVELTSLGEQLRDRIQKQLKGTSSTLNKVTVKLSSLRRTLPFSAGAFTEDNYYAEPLFDDGRGTDKTRDLQDVVPRDFGADIVVTFDITTRVAGQTVKREYTRFLDLRITDCTPPARQFALFCFEPAHTEKYVKEDLNKGGYFAVLPNASARILIRGPLVVQVEDAATDAKDLGLGGQTRDKESISWPVKGSTEWGGFATIPAPRGIDLPYFSMTLSQLIERIGSLSFTSPPIRPTDRDTGGFEIPIPFIGSFNFPTVWLLGIAPDFRTKIIDTAGILGGSIGIYQPFAPRHQVAVAGTSGYYIGAVPAGQQKFSLTGLSKEMRERLGASLTGGNTADLINPFSGVILHRTGEEAGDVSAEAASVRLPLPKGDDKLLPLATGAAELKGNDVLVTEPVYYPKALKPGVSVKAVSPVHPGDLGLFGMYGLCRFHRTIYWSFDLLQVITIIQVATTLASIPTGGFSLSITVALQGVKMAAIRFMENQAKKMFGFTVMLALLPMNYEVQSPQTPANLWNPDAGNGSPSEYALAPYGLYFDDGKPSLAGEVMQDLYLGAIGAAFSLSLKGLAKILIPLKQKAARLATKLRGENNIGRPMAGEPPLAGASERAAEGRARAANEAAAGEGTQAAGTKPEVPGAPGTTTANAAQAAAADLAKAKQALAETESLYKDAVRKRIDADAAQLRALSAKEAAERAGDKAAADAAAAVKAAEDAKLIAAQEDLLKYKAQRKELQDQVAKLETAAAATPPGSGAAETPAGTTTPDPATNPTGTTIEPANGLSSNLPAVVTQPPPPAVIDPKMVAPDSGAVKKFFPNQLNSFLSAGETAMGRFWSFMTATVSRRATALQTSKALVSTVSSNAIDHSFARVLSSATRSQLGRVVDTSALGDGADGESAKNFPKGYLPPKYRAYALGANYRYPSMEKYIEQFRARGDKNPSEVHIYLNGIVRVNDINYTHPEQTIVYHGRGIIAAQPRSGKPDEDPVFNVKAVRAADEKTDHLTLVYEPPNKDIERDSGIGQLQLGPEFGGSIYSAQGVRPAQGVRAVVIHGNLVCRHLNKQKIPDDSIVVIDYNLSQMTTDWKLNTWWAVTVSPRARRTASQ